MGCSLWVFGPWWDKHWDRMDMEVEPERGSAGCRSDETGEERREELELLQNNLTSCVDTIREKYPSLTLSKTETTAKVKDEVSLR